MSKPFTEVRCTFYDDEYTKVWYVDAWTSADDDEQGVVVATIDPRTFEVSYRSAKYKNDPLVLEVIKDKLKEIVNS